MATISSGYRVEEVPNPHVPNRQQQQDDADEDFVLIDFVMESKEGPPATRQPHTPGQTSSQTPSPSSAGGSQPPSDDDYEEYVELTVEDANLPESDKTTKSYYGIRLFQYSAESEGNIYITNDEL